MLIVVDHVPVCGIICSKCNMEAPCPFRYEADMFAPVESWMSQQGLQIKREFVVPWGVCDLVGATFDGSKVQKRLELRQRQKIGPVSRIELLLSLPDTETRRSVSLGKLERKYKDLVPKDALLRELDVLESRNFARTTRHGHYQKFNGWMPLHQRLVAVELKLSRVAEALQQAVNHYAFADESYVALPMSVADTTMRSISRIKKFEQAGVGILGVTADHCELKLPAQAKAPTGCPFQIHAAERFWMP